MLACCAMWLLISLVRIDMASVIRLLADSVIAWHEPTFPFYWATVLEVK